MFLLFVTNGRNGFLFLHCYTMPSEKLHKTSQLFLKVKFLRVFLRSLLFQEQIWNLKVSFTDC